MTLQVDKIESLDQTHELSLPLVRPRVVWKEKAPRRAVSTRFADFWLMGGASILLWLILCIAQPFRYESEIIQGRFLQMGAVFSVMTIFCNHPHFMITYKIGYGRGVRFVFKHWFTLLVVPLALALLYGVAYVKFNSQISDRHSVAVFNSIMAKVGLGFRFGTLANLGTELLSFSILIMNLTVGWHYSKQVFGCTMVYARYDSYPIDAIQRALIKASLFSVAFFNFFYLAIYAPEYNSNAIKEAYFFNIPLVPLGLPTALIPISGVICAILALAVLVGVFYANYRRTKRWPSPNLLVAWIAFYVWWIPFVRQTEFYFLAIPFFHSLQYLPFAYRLETHKDTGGKWESVRTSIRLAILLLIGWSAFEMVPSLLDEWLGTKWFVDCQFFMIAFAIFINVHHFFIDSVVWKFSQKEIRSGLFGE